MSANTSSSERSSSRAIASRARDMTQPWSENSLWWGIQRAASAFWYTEISLSPAVPWSVHPFSRRYAATLRQSRPASASPSVMWTLMYSLAGPIWSVSLDVHYLLEGVDHLHQVLGLLHD